MRASLLEILAWTIFSIVCMVPLAVPSVLVWKVIDKRRRAIAHDEALALEQQRFAALPAPRKATDPRYLATVELLGQLAACEVDLRTLGQAASWSRLELHPEGFSRRRVKKILTRAIADITKWQTSLDSASQDLPTLSSALQHFLKSARRDLHMTSTSVREREMEWLLADFASLFDAATRDLHDLDRAGTNYRE